MIKIAYFVHDLSDPAVHRRVRMLKDGGATLVLLGFRRTATPITQVEGIVPIDLGQTENARLGHRLIRVFQTRARTRRWGKDLGHVDVIMARQLEMLVIATKARQLYARHSSLVFECLDIHRLMTHSSLMGWALRKLEGKLLRRCSALVVSSPAFVRAYFQKTHAHLPRIVLLENKVLACEHNRASIHPVPMGPPWKIGWFGILRCQKSLDLLLELVERFSGKIEIVIRGKPALDVLPGFQAAVQKPGVTFLGPYDRSTDLAAIYGAVHFTWAMDFYEEGANSTWLLPNRLYEGSLYGAVPMALAPVETGRWLTKRGLGVVMNDPVSDNMRDFFTHLDPDQYALLAQRLRAQSPQDFIHTAQDTVDFLSKLNECPC